MVNNCKNLRGQDKCALGCLYRDDQLCCWFCPKKEECTSCCNQLLNEEKENSAPSLKNLPLSEMLRQEISRMAEEINGLRQGKIIFTIEDGHFQWGEIKCSWGKERRKKDFPME